MQHNNLSPETLYPHPFSKAYWRSAAAELKDVRKLTFAALMIALCVVVAQIPSIRLPGDTRVGWSFLPKATCAWVCGPVLGSVFALAEDNLSFFMSGGGGDAYFPGYTLTSVLGVLTYALFLYRAKPTLTRIFCAKLVVNIQNVVLGSLWSAILTKQGWLVIAPLRAAKNIIMLPVQVLLLVLLFKALAAYLAKGRLIPTKAAQLSTKTA